MKFYVLRDTVQGIDDTFLSFKVRNETWTDYEGLDTTELEVYDTDGVETEISPLSFTWDQVQGRYQIGSDFTNLLTFLQEQNVFKLPLTVQEQQQQNEIEQGIYKIKFYFEDLYGNVTEIGERYIDISSSYYLQDYIPEESVTKITTDVETTTLDIGDTVEVTITPRYVDTQSYQQEIQIVVTPGDISTEQGVVKSLVSSTPLHEILVHGIEDLNDIKYEFDVSTDTWTVTAVDQGDHETELGVMSDTDPEYIVGQVQSQAIGVNDSEIVISSVVRQNQSNNYTVEVVEGTGDDQQLQLDLTGTQLTITLGTDPETPQSASIGSGEDGTVTIETIDTGLQMNNYTVEVVEGVGNDVSLSAQLLSNQITVTLGTDGTGQLDPVKNTQTLVQQAIQQIDNGGQVFTQTASGTGADPLTQQEGPISFTGGNENIQSPTKNTQDIIQQEIEQIEVQEEQIFTQIQQGTDPILQQEGPTPFTGGLDPQFEIDETQEQIIYGQLDAGFTLYSTVDYSDFVLAKLSQDGKTILETINPLTDLSDTILATFQESGYAQAYNELLPLLQEQELDHIISGGIYFEIMKRGLSDVITYDTTAYAEDLRAQIQYIVKKNPGIFVITEDDPPSYPVLPYDNTTSGLDQTTIQQAIDELKQMIDEL